MAENLLKQEYWRKYQWSTSTYGFFNYTVRNGIECIQMSPSPWYNSSKSPTMPPILSEELDPNKRYEFNLWIDADDVVYQDVNRVAGLSFYYKNADDSKTAIYLTCTGNHTSPLGFQNVYGVSPAGKIPYCFNVYYWTSVNFFISLDSYITEFTPPPYYKNRNTGNKPTQPKRIRYYQNTYWRLCGNKSFLRDLRNLFLNTHIIKIILK